MCEEEKKTEIKMLSIVDVAAVVVCFFSRNRNKSILIFEFVVSCGGGGERMALSYRSSFVFVHNQA